MPCLRRVGVDFSRDGHTLSYRFASVSRTLFTSRCRLAPYRPSLARVVKPISLCGFATQNHHFWFELVRSSTATYCVNVGGPALLVGLPCACLRIDGGMRSMIELCSLSKLDDRLLCMISDLWLIVVGEVLLGTPL